MIKQSNIIVLVIILLAGTAFGCGRETAKKGPLNVARVTFISGGVTARNAAGGVRRVQFGEFLQNQDVVETEAGASLEIFLKDRGIMRISENSSLALGNLSGAEARLRMERGTAALFLKRLDKKSDFKVETPTAIASVRGTTFLVDVENPKRTRVALFQGRIDVSNRKGRTVTLDEKGEIIVQSDADIVRASIRPLSKRSLKLIKRLAVFHKNNIMEYNALVENLKSSRVLAALEVRETVEGRYARLRDSDQPGESLEKARRADEKFIKKDISGDPLKIKAKEGYQKK